MHKIVKHSFVLAIVTAIMFVFSTNMVAASMHHMDMSDCEMQISCTNCAVSNTNNPPLIHFDQPTLNGPFLNFELLGFLSTSPPVPPPKR